MCREGIKKGSVEDDSAGFTEPKYHITFSWHLRLSGHWQRPTGAWWAMGSVDHGLCGLKDNGRIETVDRLGKCYRLVSKSLVETLSIYLVEQKFKFY